MVGFLVKKTDQAAFTDSHVFVMTAHHTQAGPVCSALLSDAAPAARLCVNHQIPSFHGKFKSKWPSVYAVSYFFSGRLPLGTSMGGGGVGVRRVSGAGRAVGTRLGGAAVWESKSMQSDSGRGVFCSSFIQVLIICSL